MLLAIDVGNTNLVFAVYDLDDKLLALWRVKSDIKRSHDEYAAVLKPLFEHEELCFSDISFCLVGSVVPEIDRHIDRFATKYLTCDPVFVGAHNSGVEVQLDDPSQVGADRLINAAVVSAEYELPAIVVDFGTATTFDVIGVNGAYQGGAIAPGIRLSIDALESATAKLPKVKVEKSLCAIGKNTNDAIQSGIYWGYVGLINGVLDAIQSDLEEQNSRGVRLASIILTGGLAPLFKDTIKDTIAGAIHLDETLTLRGLLALYKRLI